MSQDPSEELVEQFLMVSDLHHERDRALARNAIRVCGGDVNKAIGEFFDNPQDFCKKYGNEWDETAFSSDRDGTSNTAGIGFNLQPPADNAVIEGRSPDHYGPTAPSRPPSRTNSRTPLDGLTDWALNGVNGGPQSQAEAEADLQRALRESAAESGVELPTQDVAMTDTSTNPTFGPATRDSYDHDSWAVVPRGPREPEASGIPPSRRKRDPDTPAFLISGNSYASRLGSILTILHEVPLARNALLQSKPPVASYGYNSEWWKGQPILPPSTLAAISNGISSFDEEQPDLAEEVQRLMAFLDSTERSYASIASFEYKLSWPSNGAEKQFFEGLEKASIVALVPLTWNVVTVERDQFDDMSEAGLVQAFVVVDMELDMTNAKNLNQAWDHVMWRDALSSLRTSGDTKTTFLRNTADVLLVGLSPSASPMELEVPETWCPEKYLLSRQNEAMILQKWWVWTKQRAAGIQEVLEERLKWKDPDSGGTYDGPDLLRKSMAKLSRRVEHLEGRARFRAFVESGFDPSQDPRTASGPCDLTPEEEKVISKCRDKISLLEAELAAAERLLRWGVWEMKRCENFQAFLGDCLSDPDRERPTPMSAKKYLLRGVVSASDTVYVCRRREQDLIEFEGAAAMDQWWKLAFSESNQQQPVTAEKVEIERVRREMWQETSTPLFVYASEDALLPDRDPLSDGLLRFVKADNKVFRQELSQESAEDAGRGPAGVVSPSKRKHRASSVDSLATNVAFLGESDREMDATDPFNDGFATEMDVFSRLSPPTNASSSSAALRRTPDTVASYEVESPTLGRPFNEFADGSAADESRPMELDDVDLVASGPEMQEKKGSTTFITIPHDGSQQGGQISLIDLENFADKSGT